LDLKYIEANNLNYFFALAPIEVGCSSSEECPSHLACINKACVSPCQCGPNAQCNVQSHIAICTCSAGYSGNPNFGCYQCKFQVNFNKLNLGKSHIFLQWDAQVTTNVQIAKFVAIDNAWTLVV
jgi:hypothetical protein